MMIYDDFETALRKLRRRQRRQPISAVITIPAPAAKPKAPTDTERIARLERQLAAALERIAALERRLDDSEGGK